MAKLIGLSGYARSGKDTVADFLTSEHGFTKVSFAQPMRDALYALNPYLTSGQYVQNVIDMFGWDGYKATLYGTEIRELLQRLGTEVGRKQWGEYFWIDTAFNSIEYLLEQDESVVITDVRFENEAKAIKAWSGEVWRVRRPGVFPANDHASETGMDDWEFDAYIDNNGSLEDLGAIIDGHF